MFSLKEKNLSTKSKKLRIISLFWDYMSALSLIALLVLLWNLGKGPIKVNFLRPYIIQALTNETSSYDLSVGSVNLELAHSLQPINIIAKDVSFKANDDSYLIEAPRLSLSFSARALLKGMLAPSAINIENPQMMVKNVYGLKKSEVENKELQREVTLKKLEFFFTQFEDFIARFNSDEQLYLENFINDIDVTGATLTVHEVETGQQFSLTDMNFFFDRELTNLRIRTDSAIEFENRTSAMDMVIKYHLLNDEVTWSFNFSDLVVTDLYDLLVSEKTDIRAVDIPVNGQLNATIDFGKMLQNKSNFADTMVNSINEISFAIEGGAGKIDFGDSEDFDYDVSSFNLKGVLHGGLDKIDIKNAAFDFDGKEALLSLSAKGFKDYLLKGDLENFTIGFNAKVGSFAMDELSDLWPKYLGEKAWAWCKEGLYGGTISNGNFTFDFGWDKKTNSFGLTQLKGSADVSDANLYYLEGMPVIKNVYGTASFSSDKIAIKVEKGVSDGVILTGGTVILYDLDKYDNFIKIDLKGNSTITDALLLIDHEPLGFTKEMGINPKEMAGDVDIDLKLDFELKTDLKPEEIKVEVLGDLKQVKYLGLSKDETLVADNLKLKVTEKGFDLTGEAKYQNIPINLTIQETFNEKKYKSRVVTDVKIDDKALKILGIDSEILQAPYFTGTSELHATLTEFHNGTEELLVDGSLKDVAMDYAFLGFSKPKGIPCRAKAKILFKDNVIKSVPEFSLLKSQFSAKGNISIADNKITAIDITEIKSPKTFAKAKVNLSYKPKLKLKVTVTGDAYDLTEFFDSKKPLSDEEKEKKKKNLKDPFEDMMDSEIIVSVNKLWTNNDVPVTNFAGRAEIKNGKGMHKMSMVGNYGTSRDVQMKLNYEPRGEEYILNIDSNNAGSTLKVLRLYENMRGGNLKIEAKRDKYKNFHGFAKIRDFSLVNTPIFAKVLALASLTGILDTLKGDGLRFTHLDAPFRYTFSTKDLSTDEAKMFGPSVGLKASGSYNLVDEALNIKGMLIPAYGINKFLGNLPLVGKVLAGKDGTIFATNYSIKGTVATPKISINPLSTLAPNSIKELFSSSE